MIVWNPLSVLKFIGLCGCSKTLATAVNCIVIYYTIFEFILPRLLLPLGDAGFIPVIPIVTGGAPVGESSVVLTGSPVPPPGGDMFPETVDVLSGIDVVVIVVVAGVVVVVAGVVVVVVVVVVDVVVTV